MVDPPGDERYGVLFDAHFHVIDHRFPLVPNRGYLPDPFTAQDYLRVAGPLGVRGGAVVSGSFQAFDQSYLVEALRRLGPAFVGVTQLPADTTEERIGELHAAGVRAVRFNLYRGGSAGAEALESLGRRVFETPGWHVELYVDARDLPQLAPTLLRLPRVVIDHLGLSQEGFPELLRLVEQGGHVKATGFGWVDLEVSAALRAIVDVNPEALVFGTDLPSTRAPRPFEPSDVETVVDALEDERLVSRVLWENAVRLYRPGRPTPTPDAT